MRDARERQAEGRIKRNEKWGTKDMEHQDLLCNIIDQHIKFHPSDDFYGTFLTPLILIRQLTHYDSHTALRQYPLLIKSSHWIKSSFHFYLNFPMMSHCVSFYYSFSFWFIIWFIMLFWKGTFWNFPLTHWWTIAYWSLKMLLSHFGFPSCI